MSSYSYDPRGDAFSALTGHVAVKAATSGDWKTYINLLIPAFGLTALGTGILLFGLYL